MQFHQMVRLRAYQRKKQFGNQVYITKTKLLKPNSNGHDYLAVNLCKNHKRYSRYVHRLVANAFLPNPNNYPQINHKNENRNDNKVKNLEWCSCQYNINYGHRAKRYEKARGYRVGQFTPTGVLIRKFDSIHGGMRTTHLSLPNWKLASGSICRAHGYVWKILDYQGGNYGNSSSN